MGRPIGQDTHLCSPWPRSAAGAGLPDPWSRPPREVLSRCWPHGGAHGRGARTKGRGRAGLQAAEVQHPGVCFHDGWTHVTRPQLLPLLAFINNVPG